MPNSTQQPQAQLTPSSPETRAAAAEQIIGFRIMRETEIAPHWWATPIEIGETGSIVVADQFCAEQNKVTLDPNRVKRHRYYIDPIIPVVAA
ncbi:hypothetical protein [Streptomyces bobili]|uniref:hypothetical protein n=1 Tax=Streptomyces bobili TaxID=67280 RepID=UPI0037A1E569